MAKYSTSDLLRDLKDLGANVTDTHLKDAESSEINSENNTEFRELLNDWKSGVYDEDPNTLVNEIINLL